MEVTRMPQPQQLTLVESDNVLIARPTADNLLDPVAVQQFRLELMAVLAERNPPKLLVSFANVARCATDVINSLLMAKKRMLTEGGEVRICALSENIRHTFRILNLEGTVFQTFETEEEALIGF